MTPTSIELVPGPASVELAVLPGTTVAVPVSVGSSAIEIEVIPAYVVEVGGGGGGGGPHASSHAASGSDPVLLAQSQIVGLVSALASKATQSALLALEGVVDLKADQTDLELVVLDLASKASQSYVDSILGNPPPGLDTLESLATAINNDPDFSATVGALIGTKIASSVLEANSVLYALSDGVPQALLVGEESLVGRAVGGSVAALNASQVRSLLGLGSASLSSSSDFASSAQGTKADTAVQPGDLPSFGDIVTRDASEFASSSHDHSGIYEPAGTASGLVSDLSGVTSPSAARSNLGLGTSATRDVGTASGQVSAGDHVHGVGDITGAVPSTRIIGGVDLSADRTLDDLGITQPIHIEPATISGTQQYGFPNSNYTSIATAVALGANVIWYVPFVTYTPIALSRIGIEVTTFVNPSNVRIGVYAATAAWQPTGAALIDEVQNSSTNGAKVATISTTLQAGRYLACVVSDSAISIRAGQRFDGPVQDINATTFGGGASVILGQRRVAQTYGALPNTGTAWTTTTAANAISAEPLFVMKWTAA